MIEGVRCYRLAFELLNNRLLSDIKPDLIVECMDNFETKNHSIVDMLKLRELRDLLLRIRDKFYIQFFSSGFFDI